MKTYLLAILFLCCSVQVFYSQEDDGVVSLALPVRNSLKFNRYVVNPTFSFVREQNKYISIYNKREWVQFDDAPQTYLLSYSGRFRENIGIGVGLFQQNYGVLTTFGGLLNFAYNARLDTDSNLTFGMNIGAYKSGVNSARVVTNYSDPSLENIPSNFLLTVNPGINYGTGFLDIGVSINNLVLYNFKTSELIKDNPQQSIQAHLMYTGYIDSYGFFDESKFSGLLRSEFGKDKTIISANAMLTVPKGIWAQVGYNTLYGASGGFGLNISSQIAIEYNFEKALGDLTNFGPSHEITLAFKFKNNEHYDYSSEDEIGAIISPTKKRVKPSTQPKISAETRAQLEAEAQAKRAQKQAEFKANEEAKAKIAEDAAKAKAAEAAEAKAKEDAAAKAKADLEAEAIAKEVAQAKAKIAADKKAKEAIETRAKLARDAQAKLDAENKAKAEAKLIAEKQAKEAAEIKAQKEAQAQAELAAQAQAKIEAEKNAKAALVAETKAKEDAEAKAKAEAEAKEQLIANPTDNLGKSMSAVAKLVEDSETAQQQLLTQLSEAVANKDKDLKDLKEENDLSDKGIYLEPKPFKSITAENNALEALKSDLDKAIKMRNDKIKELEDLYEQRQRIATLENDEVNLYYKNTIERLKAEQFKAIQTKTSLTTSLDAIKEATEFERKRRIKRAVYNNEEDRFEQDIATLNAIKRNTELSSVPLKADDFDFGEEQSNNNIQILKNVKHVDNGYYIIIAVHNNIEKRDEFLTKAVSAGQSNIDFFYDVNTSKYYIYYEKFDTIEAANDALKSKGNKPYNSKMSIVKIEN
ncbi:MAG: PorP/SprF family type IX secretion system membrane protein [Gelidibacter sp.]